MGMGKVKAFTLHFNPKYIYNSYFKCFVQEKPYFPLRILKSRVDKSLCEELMRNNRLKTLKISTIAITSVVLVEVVLGIAVGSLAILSDGVHALLDAFAMFVLLIATKASLKPPDEEHMYGHEKLESVGGLIGGVVLIGTALFLMVESVQKLVKGQPYFVQDLEYAGFAAIAYTFFIDILRVKVLHGAERESSTVKAGFYHAIADLGSTIVAFFGFGLATIGFFAFDALASIILSIMINYLSIKVIWSSGMELSDATSKDVVEKVRREILSTDGICKCEDLKVRKAGAKTFVEATVQAPDYMSFEEAHSLASKVEETLKKSLGDTSVTIHVEPLEREMQTEKLVEKLATEINGVKEVHEVSTVCADGKLYVILHARVDPKLSVQEAHELAEKIENKISEKIGNVENVTVHIEPFSPKQKRGTTANEGEIQKIVHKIAENFKQTLYIKKVVTYVSGRKRYINIDCSFTKELSIEEAHKIASEIEENIKKRFAETTVTVHMEPKKGK
jgi:cation diffusion facilitator family transporter